MWPVSDKFLKAVESSHQIEVRADLYYDGNLLQEGLPITSGSVSISRRSGVRRTMSLNLATTGAPNLLTDPLLPNGSEIQLFRGIKFSDSDLEMVPLGVFRIDATQIKRPYFEMVVSGSDRSIMLQDDKFLGPEEATAATIRDEIKRLVGESVAGSVVIDDQMTSTDAMWSDAVWDKERWKAIQDLADSIGADVCFDQIGQFRMRPVATKDTPSVVEIGEGFSPVITASDITLDRLSTYNAIVLTTEMADEEKIEVTMLDEDPDSPTRYGGPFGKRPLFVTADLVTSQAQAQTMASSELAKYQGMPRQMSLSSVPNPALDVNDVITVGFLNGVAEIHVVDQISLGLGADQSMRVRTRTLGVVDGSS
jgi:hypothetical protein